ncbi:MAG: hypothetical protein WCC97_08385 [Candidatus Acidiferrales bacterium]
MMNTKQKVDKLWEDFRAAINAAYAEAEKSRNDDGLCLRDYAENISWSDALRDLLARETANERQHRSNRPSVAGFSAETAAKLILMQQAGIGALQPTMPCATAFLVFRQSAVEAQVIGFLAKKHLTVEWRVALAEFDYAKLMQPATDAVSA